MSRRGFTLIELLIVLAVLAIVAGMVVTSTGNLGTSQLEAAARILAADLRLARSLAVQHGAEWTVEFDTDGRGYELKHTGTGNPPLPRNPLAPAGTDDRYRVQLGSNGSRTRGTVRISEIRLGSTGQTVSDVRFQPLGGTGPGRSEDTLIRLVAEGAPSQPFMVMTVSWITGQVWIAPIDQSPTKTD